MRYEPKVEIALVIVSVDILNPADTKILLLNDTASPRLPTSEIAAELPLVTIASHLLKKYTNQTPRLNGVGYVDLVPGQAVHQPGKIVIPYGCMIPEVVPLLDYSAAWTNLSKLFAMHTSDKYMLDVVQQMILLL